MRRGRIAPAHLAPKYKPHRISRETDGNTPGLSKEKNIGYRMVKLIRQLSPVWGEFY